MIAILGRLKDNLDQIDNKIKNSNNLLKDNGDKNISPD